MQTLHTLHTIAERISRLDVSVDVAWVPQQFYRQFDADSVCVLDVSVWNEWRRKMEMDNQQPKWNASEEC